MNRAGPMNERFFLRFQLQGENWPADEVTSDYIVLREADPIRRRVILDFRPRGAVTAYRLDRIRELQGWHPWEFRLVPFLDQGALGFRGVDTAALPHGLYSCNVRLEDAHVRMKKRDFELPPGGVATVDVPVRRDTRRVEARLDDCDAEIARLLDVAGSLENRSPREWLALEGPRAKRKACLLNILASLRVTPTVSAALITDVARIFHVADDRIYAATTLRLFDRVDRMAKDPDNRTFWPESAPKAEIHRRLLQALPPPDDAAGYRLLSYRAEGPAGLQVVFAVPPTGHPSRYYAEFDIDLGNPLQDVAGFVIHMGELLDNHPTDHLDLRDKLRKRAGEYLYYRVLKA